MLTIMLLIDVVTMVNIYGYNGYCGCCGYYDGVIVTYTTMQYGQKDSRYIMTK